MSSRSQRVSNGIDSLVRRLLVEIPGEDAASAEERELNAVDFVREVLERYIALGHIFCTLEKTNFYVYTVPKLLLWSQISIKPPI